MPKLLSVPPLGGACTVRSKSALRVRGKREAHQFSDASLYRVWVVPYLDFVIHHRGRRTTHQLENGLGRFCAWLEAQELNGLDELTPSLLQDFISSLKGFPTFHDRQPCVGSARFLRLSSSRRRVGQGLGFGDRAASIVLDGPAPAGPRGRYRRTSSASYRSTQPAGQARPCHAAIGGALRLAALGHSWTAVRRDPLAGAADRSSAVEKPATARASAARRG